MGDCVILCQFAIMVGLLGEFEVSLDSKGRLLIPAGFKKQLQESESQRFVINRGFEPCLVLYTLTYWAHIAGNIEKLNDFNPKVRAFKRMFLNGASYVDVDSAGRILIPKSLQEYAGLDKDILFSAQGNKVEIWNKASYHEHIAAQINNFSDLAQEVAGHDFLNPFE